MAYKDKEDKKKWQKAYNTNNREKINKQNREWVKKNPEKARLIQRRSEFKKKYGLTIEDYEAMFASQKGLCAICLKHQSQFRLKFAVDHCHEKGHVRSLLCGNCNTALGLIKEDPQTLQRMIAYTMRNGAKL